MDDDTKTKAAIGAGLTAATAAALSVPKARKKVKKELPGAVNVVKRSDHPGDLKEELQNEMRPVVADRKRDEFQENLQTKVYSNAKTMEKKAQDGLLQVREKLAKVKEAGEDFQTSMRENNPPRAVRGADDIKGISHIKSSTGIKGAADIKSPQQIKHHSAIKHYSS
ncbi:hypothetical protein ACFO3D_07425 [Virgibacillus kekensis]|uniref:Gas vesicle protein n=1 Tax=Virgibacillus kekensis TaxID=202261 RepID=A0ABV9DGW7_9BACI